MTKRIRRTVVFCAVLLAAFLLIRYASRLGVGIPCAIYAITGLYCPGCGSTRALIAVSELDFYQAFRYNAFFTLCLPFLSVEVVMSVYRYIKFGKPVKSGRYDVVIAIIAIMVAALFMIARNIGSFSYLSPTVVR